MFSRKNKPLTELTFWKKIKPKENVSRVSEKMFKNVKSFPLQIF